MRKLLLGLLTFLVVGVVSMRFTIEDGMRRYADAEANAAVEKAYALARAHRDHPLQRFFAPAASVVTLVILPGACPGQDAGAASSSADEPDGESVTYAAQVRFHTIYGINVGDLYVACGNVTDTEPPGWPGQPVPLDSGEERDLRWS